MCPKLCFVLRREIFVRKLSCQQAKVSFDCHIAFHQSHQNIQPNRQEKPTFISLLWKKKKSEKVCEIFRISKTTLSLALITRYQRYVQCKIITFVVYVEEALIFNAQSGLNEKKIYSRSRTGLVQLSNIYNITRFFVVRSKQGTLPTVGNQKLFCIIVAKDNWRSAQCCLKTQV